MRAAKPHKVTHSIKLDLLKRLNRDFAVRPVAFNDEHWAERRMSYYMGEKSAEEKKMLIHEADLGLDMEFPAEQMALIIRTMLKSDDKD